MDDSLDTPGRQALKVAVVTDGMMCTDANKQGWQVVRTPVEVLLKPLRSLLAYKYGAVFLAFATDSEFSSF